MVLQKIRYGLRAKKKQRIIMLYISCLAFVVLLLYNKLYMLQNLKNSTANISNRSIFPLPLHSQQINTGQIKAFCKCSADECTAVMGHEGLIRWGGEVTANQKKRGYKNTKSFVGTSLTVFVLD